MTQQQNLWWTCPVCGKRFKGSSSDWAYFRWSKGKKILYCSWRCYRTLPEKRTYNKRE